MRWKLKTRRLTGREIRFVCMLGLVLAVGAWKFLPRPWHPTIAISTAHYEITSTASSNSVAQVSKVTELLYSAYLRKFAALHSLDSNHPKLKLRLYKNRDEFRHVNAGAGWAEAFYSRGLCHAYFSDAEINPYHWMLHECVHQLNREVAHLDLEKWLDEGLAEYFSCSRIRSNELAVGTVDLNTYPVWWVDEIATSPNLQTNLTNGSVIPLRSIITGKGGPSLDKEFNLYYLHWWSLTHFIYQHPIYSKNGPALLEHGGDLKSFEQLIGPIDKIQEEWHKHVRHLKALAAGKDLHFLKTGEVSPDPGH
jgi:hypothetical protein